MDQTGGRDHHCVERLHRQARERLESGDVQGARQCWEAALQIDPDDSAALQGLVSTEGNDAAQAISLDLDLSLGSASPAESASLQKPRVATRSSAVTTLEVEPVKDEGVDPAGFGSAADGTAQRLSTPETEGREATLLVSRARQALAAGRLDEAMDLASRALVVSEGMPSAQLVLDGARAEAGRRAGEVERMLTDAIVVFESGGVQDSVRLFERVLELLPDHAEARDYLSRANAALAADADDAEQDLESIESIPLETLPPVEDDRDDVAETEAEGEDAGALDLGGTLTRKPVSRPQRSAEPGAEGLPLGPPTAIAGRAGAGAGSVRAAGRRAGSGSPGRWISIALAAAASLAAVWFVPGMLGSEPADRPPQAQADTEVPAAKTPQDAETRESRPEQVSEPSGQSAERSTQATEPPAPRYTRADVPALLAGARESLAAGDEERAVELLRAAQIADPANMEVIERLDRAQKAHSERRIARERVEQGRKTFAEGQYAEALRVFYRVPEAYRPEALERWIAAGWYNLGVQSLQAGSPAESIQFFTDALNLVPGDPEAVRHREVALRYRTRPMDDAYRIYVGSLQMRPLPR